MSALGYWASVLAGTMLLVGATVFRRRLSPQRKLDGYWNGMSLLAVAMIIGPLPWAIDRGSDTVRIAASTVSILASISAVVLITWWRIAGRAAAQSRSS